MKIMIGGGFDDENPDSIQSQKLIAFAENLAKQVILQGHQLRCGNLTQLDATVINAACEVLGDKANKQHVISYISQGNNVATEQGTVRDSSNPDWNSMSGRKPQTPEPIDYAGITSRDIRYGGSRYSR